MSISRRTFLAASAAGLLLPADARAETWPGRVVSIIVPFAAGGATDIVGRLVAAILKERFQQSFIVENRPGAGGNIGVEAAARSAPDGYTLLQATGGNLTINPHLYVGSTLNIERDLSPISMTFVTDHVLVINPKLNIKTAADLIAMARAEPGRLTFGSAGIGSAAHLYAEYLKALTGIQIVHVPYKGTGPALVDVVAGHIDMMLDSIPSSLGQITTGGVRAIATTGPRASRHLPGVPPLNETVPEYEAVSWGALLAPKNTPQAIVARISEALRDALARPETVETFAKSGADAVGSSPEQVLERIRTDSARWGKLIAQAAIKVQ